MARRVPANASSSPSVKLIQIFLIFVYLAGVNYVQAQTLGTKRTQQAEQHTLVGVEYFRQNKLREAEREFLKAIRTDPDYGQAYNNLAYVYKHQKRYRKAEITFKQALERADTDELKTQVNYNLGDLLSGYNINRRTGLRGGLQRALEYYLAALSYSEDNPRILCRIGEVYWEMKKRPQALEYFSRASKNADQRQDLWLHKKLLEFYQKEKLLVEAAEEETIISEVEKEKDANETNAN